MGYHDSVSGRYRAVGDVQGLSLEQLRASNPDGPEDHGKEVRLDNGNTYVYDAFSTITADGAFVIEPDNHVGRFLLAPGRHFDLALPIGFGTADAAVLATVPAGAALLLGRSHWEITENWTGGSSSAIGISSDQAPYNTKGDLLGGAAGDVEATLVASAGRVLGTIGADVAAGILLKGGATIRFDRITSAFTAGSGFAHIVGTCLAMP